MHDDTHDAVRPAQRSPSADDSHPGQHSRGEHDIHYPSERRREDHGAPDGRDRRGLTEREKRERWPIG